MIHGPPAPAVFSRILADVQANFAQLCNQQRAQLDTRPRACGYLVLCILITGQCTWIHMETDSYMMPYVDSMLCTVHCVHSAQPNCTPGPVAHRQIQCFGHTWE
jgi:hypothetical protein